MWGVGDLAVLRQRVHDLHESPVEGLQRFLAAAPAVLDRGDLVLGEKREILYVGRLIRYVGFVEARRQRHVHIGEGAGVVRRGDRRTVTAVRPEEQGPGLRRGGDEFLDLLHEDRRRVLAVVVGDLRAVLIERELK